MFAQLYRTKFAYSKKDLIYNPLHTTFRLAAHSIIICKVLHNLCLLSATSWEKNSVCGQYFVNIYPAMGCMSHHSIILRKNVGLADKVAKKKHMFLFEFNWKSPWHSLTKTTKEKIARHWFAVRFYAEKQLSCAAGNRIVIVWTAPYEWRWESVSIT